MKSKKTDWKLPAIILLALLLILEMADIYRLARSGDTQPLPVLMYHHFADVSFTISPYRASVNRKEIFHRKLFHKKSILRK